MVEVEMTTSQRDLCLRVFWEQYDHLRSEMRLSVPEQIDLPKLEALFYPKKLKPRSTDSIVLSVESYEAQRKHIASVERDRSDLWGVNEELRETILALQRGQEDLLTRIAALRFGLEAYAKGVNGFFAQGQLNRDDEYRGSDDYKSDDTRPWPGAV